MKNWKKYLALLTALLLVVAFTACTSVEEEPSDPPAEQTEASTEAPTEETTEAPTEADYSAYMGKWYSGRVTFEVKEEKKWTMLDGDEVFMTGHFVVTENGSLTLYDVEGMEVANMYLDADGSIYAELYVEEMYNRVEDFTFLRTAPEGDLFGDVDDTVVDGENPEYIPEVEG